MSGGKIKMALVTLCDSQRGLINSTHGIEPLATEKTNNYRTPHRIFPLLEPNSYDEIAGKLVNLLINSGSFGRPP